MIFIPLKYISKSHCDFTKQKEQYWNEFYFHGIGDTGWKENISCSWGIRNDESGQSNSN